MKRAPHTDHRTKWPSKTDKFINSPEFVDKMVKQYYNDAITFSNLIKSPLLTRQDKESFALEALYEAAGLFDSTKGMKFTSFLYVKVKQLLLRELRLARGQRRCNQIPFSEIFSDAEIEDGAEDETTSPQKKRCVRDIPESATYVFQENGIPHSIFDRYIKREAELPFDIDDAVKLLNARLSDVQRHILGQLLKDDVNGSDVARDLGITRQAVNLHLQTIRRHTKDVLKKLAPEINLGE